MLGIPQKSMAGRPKAAVPSISGIEYLDSIVGTPAAAGHVNFDATPTTSAAVAA